MTQSLSLRRMPDGTRCRTYFCLPMKTVWPALLPPCVADDDVRLLGQHVNDLAFAFVAPLGADQNCICHKFNKNPRTSIRGQKQSTLARGD